MFFRLGLPSGNIFDVSVLISFFMYFRDDMASEWEGSTSFPCKKTRVVFSFSEVAVCFEWFKASQVSASNDELGGDSALPIFVQVRKCTGYFCF